MTWNNFQILSYLNQTIWIMISNRYFSLKIYPTVFNYIEIKFWIIDNLTEIPVTWSHYPTQNRAYYPKTLNTTRAWGTFGSQKVKSKIPPISFDRSISLILFRVPRFRLASPRNILFITLTCPGSSYRFIRIIRELGFNEGRRLNGPFGPFWILKLSWHTLYSVSNHFVKN